LYVQEIKSKMNLLKQIAYRKTVITIILVGFFLLPSTVFAIENPQSGGVGVQGTISSPPPTTAPTISTPGNGATFTTLPVVIKGICTNDLLVKVFKNNVFSGSAVCKNGSYELTIDLFSSKNDLTARHYDALDQAGPDSNLVSVTFNDNAARPEIAARISLTTNYARRGANPKELLQWPMVLSGGVGPYAVTIDWGDKVQNDLQTVATPGEFIIKHTYDSAGVYKILVKAVDKNGAVAYMQLVGVGNGAVDPQKTGAVAGATAGKTVILWQPAAIAIPLLISTFWVGKKYEVKRIKKRVAEGKHPFGG
jgi:hypothetical protein